MFVLLEMFVGISEGEMVVLKVMLVAWVIFIKTKWFDCSDKNGLAGEKND